MQHCRKQELARRGRISEHGGDNTPVLARMPARLPPLIEEQPAQRPDLHLHLGVPKLPVGAKPFVPIGNDMAADKSNYRYRRKSMTIPHVFEVHGHAVGCMT
jgi:hypothetical protein